MDKELNLANIAKITTE